MEMTTVADGLFQYGGAPVGVNPVYNKIFSTKYPERKGRAWFVDASSGVDGNGTSPGQAFATMEGAFNVLASGDIIYAIGNITEQLVTPVQIFDVTIAGVGKYDEYERLRILASWATEQHLAPSSPLR